MAYTAITGSRTDADSPIDEDLVGDLAANGAYNYSNAMRVGTNAVGVRRAWACGRSALWTFTTSGGGDASTTAAVTFSSGSEDGDPNFLTGETPIVTLTLEENDDGDSVPWITAGDDTPVAYIGHGTLSATGFTAEIAVASGTSSQKYEGYLHWTATALVDTGE